MAAGRIRAGRAFVELSTDDSALVRGLARAQARLRAFGASMQSIGRNIALVGGAITAALGAAVRVFATSGDELEKMSRRTGLTVESLSALKFAAEQSGTDIGSLEKSVARMQRTLKDADRGLSTATDALADLGLTTADLADLTPEQQFKLLADRLAQVEDPSRKAAIAMQLFGRSGTAIIPLIEQGAAGIEQLQQKARDLGITMDKETAVNAAKLSDAFNKVTNQAKQAVIQIGASLAPALTKVGESLTEIVPRAIDWIKANRETIVTVASLAVKTLAIGVALLALGKAISLVASGIGGLITVIKALRVASAFLIANPIALAFTAAAAAATALAIATARSSKETAKLLEQTNSIVDATQRRNREARTQIARLQELAGKERRTAQEQAEAKRIIESLQGTYGDLGISINEATGAINGMKDAQLTLNQAMRETTAITLEAEMIKLQRRLRELEKESLPDTMDAISVLLQGGFIADASISEEIRAVINEFRALKRQVDTLRRGGNVSDVLFGGDEDNAPGASLPDDAASTRVKTIQQLQEELARLDEQAARRRRTSLQNEIADLRTAASEREAILKRLIELRLQELEDVPADQPDEQLGNLLDRVKQNREQLQNDIAAAEQAARRDRLRAEEELAEDIARLRIEATKEGIERELALLELDRELALEQARDQGIDTDLVNKRFDLRRQIIEGGREAEKQLTRGLFNVARIQGLQGSNSAQDRLLRVNENMDRNIERLKQVVEDQAIDGGLAFA